MSDLSIILDNLERVKKEGKINVYAVKNVHRPVADSYAVALPSNQNKVFLHEYCDTLNIFSTCNCVKYDAIEHKENTYEYIELSSLKDIWEKFENLLNSDSLRRNNYEDFVSEINLTLCELVLEGKKYYLGTLQEKSEKTFKGKFPLFADEGKLALISPKKMITLTLKVDFVVSTNDGIIYILNRKNFQKIFNYYEILKKHVIEKSNVIDAWTFIENSDFIKEKLDTGYVYKSLSKIIDDNNYLEDIKNTKPKTLKKRLLEKSSGVFTEEDFKNNKLQINRSNMEKIIKMISKGFKYNFFTDKAED